MAVERYGENETSEVKVISISSRESKPRDPEEAQPAENINPGNFLKNLKIHIDPNAIISGEKRPDGAIILHCNNLYEYLRAAFEWDKDEAAKIEKHRKILELVSSEETLREGLEKMGKLGEEDKQWVKDKLGAAGSAIPMESKDGWKMSVVVMNDMPTKRKFNLDMTPRSESQLKAYDEDYKRIIEHEVRHVKFFMEYGRAMDEWKEKLGSLLGALTRLQLKKFHFDRYTKDEIAAHMENNIKKGAGQIEIDWNAIVENLQKPDYTDASGKNLELFKSEEDLSEYREIVEKLVSIARDEYSKTRSIESVVKKLHSTDVAKYLRPEKVPALAA